MERIIRIGYMQNGYEEYAVRIPGSPTIADIQAEQNDPVQIGVLGSNGWRPAYTESVNFADCEPSAAHIEEVIEQAESKSYIHKERYSAGTVYYMSEENMHECYMTNEELTAMCNSRYMMPQKQVCLPAVITQNIESERDIVDTLDGRYSVNRDSNNRFTLQVSVDATSEIGITAIAIFQQILESGYDAYIQVETPVEGQDCLLLKQIIVRNLEAAADNLQENLTNITMEYEYVHAEEIPSLETIAQRTGISSAASSAYTTAQIEDMRAQLEALVARYDTLVSDNQTLKERLVQLILSGNIGGGGVCETSTAADGISAAQAIAADIFGSN